MTKDDLLRDHDKYLWACHESEHVVPYSAAEKAMDEWAKQQAFAFHVFIMNNIWQYNASEDTWHQYNWHSEGVSYEVVWNQFIEQQTKDK